LRASLAAAPKAPGWPPSGDCALYDSVRWGILAHGLLRLGGDTCQDAGLWRGPSTSRPRSIRFIVVETVIIETRVKSVKGHVTLDASDARGEAHIITGLEPPSSRDKEPIEEH
jgi:hypothetical protein